MSRRKQRLAGDLGQFMNQYGRKKRPGKGEPNDRKYDRKIESIVKRMDPEELDELLRGDNGIDGSLGVYGVPEATGEYDS